MKKGTKQITAMADVKSVQNFVKLSEEDIINVLEVNQDKLNLSTNKNSDGTRNVCV